MMVATGQPVMSIPAKGVQPQGETIQELTSALQQRQSVDQNMVAISGLQNQAMAAEREFATGTPDYYQAVQHLQDFRHRQLA